MIHIFALAGILIDLLLIMKIYKEREKHMKNCIVAQSGGPTAVINSSVVGVVEENNRSKIYDNVYGGLNGIEGILGGQIINLSKLDSKELNALKYTPSSGLGSCRYKLKDYKTDESEYKKLIQILNKFSIKAFFYIGGNDSMDTVDKLSKYAEDNSLDIQFIGIPKTIDNDLVCTDHTPGFGSAAKYVATTVLESYLDSNVYPYNGVFIMEIMGREAGWLAASAALGRINGKPAADFIYLPEVPFSSEKFLEDVNEKLKVKNSVFVAVSEGIRDKNGRFIAQMGTEAHDKFGHVQLGGVCGNLKKLLLDNKVSSKVKTLELGVTQRSAMHIASQQDIDEAYRVGSDAVIYSSQGSSGVMVGITRESNTPYKMGTKLVKASDVANNIKSFPIEWITSEGNHVTEKTIEYMSPLIIGEPVIRFENGLPKYYVVNRDNIVK